MKFTKVQGTGNDFVLIEGFNLNHDWPTLARHMCDRHFGVGADGVLLVQPSKVADFKMSIFNADGSEAEMCGNGIRCFTKYIIDRKLAPAKKELAIETKGGVRTISAAVKNGKVRSVRVGMGQPRLKPAEIPVLQPDLSYSGDNKLEKLVDYPVVVAGETMRLTCVSMGNPHAVLFTDTPVDKWPLHEEGPEVEHHFFFPQRVNFEIVNVLDKGHLKARVWERGVGETLACGSGACAIAVASRLQGRTADKVGIDLPGGTLQVQWDGHGEVWLEGPAEVVFDGEWGE